MQVDFEHRSPTTEDTIKVGMIDLQSGKWIELGTSTAWNWQQGCMLQWRPRHNDEVMWNDRVDGKFSCHILNVKTRQKRTIPFAIFCVSPEGKYALSHDFERVQDVRAGYGYVGVADKNKNELAPADAGIYRISLDSGTRELIISLKTIATIPYPIEDLSSYKHYFNGVLYNPSGSRFALIHRWAVGGEAARVSAIGTRFISASGVGNDIRVINDSRMTSHHWWRDDNHILAWANRPEVGDRFFIFDDRGSVGKNYSIFGDGILKEDGHCSYLPNKDWIILDTYPDKNNSIELYLFNERLKKKITLGKFFVDPKYSGEWRVDLHPRQSRDGKRIFIDCPVGKQGRQILMFDISKLNLLPDDK
jgi:hypothetical protein